MGVTSIIRAALGLTAAAALASCSAAPRPPSETDMPTFVSLNPCLDAILAEIADPEQILALSHYSSDPAASSMDVELARTFAETGGTAEEVIALRPDVVLASTFIAPATKAALERSGLRVETFGSPTSVAQSVEQVRALARLAERDTQGERLVETITQASAAPPSSGATALLWQSGEIVAGEVSLVVEHLEWAGFANYAEASGLAQADRVSLEQLLADPPRLLLVAGDSAGQRHPILANLRTTMVADFPPGLFYCAGPSIPRARAQLLTIRERFEREYYQPPQ